MVDVPRWATFMAPLTMMLRCESGVSETNAVAVMIPEVLILSAVPTPTPVSADPSIAGSVPVILAAGTFVKFAALIAGSVPVIFAAGILVRFAADIAGNVPVKFAAGRFVKFAPEP